MHEVVAAKSAEIEDLCRALNVRRLDVFGSAAGDSFDVATSDVDVLVDFETSDRFGSFFALKEGLERILGRPVDLLVEGSIRNPYLRREVMDTRENLFSA